MNNFYTRASLTQGSTPAAHAMKDALKTAYNRKEDVTWNTAFARCVGRAVVRGDVSAPCDRYATPPDPSGSL